MADYTKYLTSGAKYLSSSGRHGVDRLMQAIGSSGGKLNSASDVGGIVNEYLAAMPYRDKIMADIEAGKAAGTLSSADRGTLMRGFAAADRTKAMGDQIAGYLDENLPNRLPNLSKVGYTPPQGGVLDLSTLNAHPADVIGTRQSPMWLPVSHQFDMQDFTNRMTPERVGALRKLAQAGADIGGNTWYNMAPVQAKFVEHFGPEAGNAMFRDWAGRNAVLSPRSGVVDQTVRQSQLDYLKNQTGEYPDNATLKAGSDTFGHLANDVHIGGLENWDETGDLIKSGARPKIGSYFQNYMGNWLPGTMDTHHFAAAGLSEQVPQVLKRQLPDGSWVPRLDERGDPMTQMSSVPISKYYQPLELASAHMAARMGLDPAQFQSSVWTGLTQRPDLMGSGKSFVPRTADPFAAIYDKVLTDSAGLRGTDPDQHFSDVATMQDYLTRPRGVAKSRNFDLDQGEGYAGGGTVAGSLGALSRVARSALDQFGHSTEAPAGTLGIVKNNNGQWLGGNVQRFLAPLMKPVPELGGDPSKLLQSLKEAMHHPDVTASPDAQQYLQSKISPLEPLAAHNDWINNVLGKTIQNKVAAPGDPFRALADQGITHFPTPDALMDREYAEALPSIYEKNRKTLQDRGQLTQLANTDLGESWEKLADTAVEPHKPGFYSTWAFEANPWMNTVDPMTSVHRMDPDVSPDMLGLQHLSDAVTRHIENKGTAQNLSVEKAIRAAHDWHQQQLDQMANGPGQSTVREYPDTPQGLKWVELNSPDQSTLQSQLTHEGESMGHCVGNYCDDVMSGKSRIFSLRDTKGKPHVTVEVAPGVKAPERDEWGAELPSQETPPPSIVQIRGKQNDAPVPEYHPYVQDLIKNPPEGVPGWDRVSDAESVGMLHVPSLKTPEQLPGAHGEIARVYPYQMSPTGGATVSGRVSSDQLMQDMLKDYPHTYATPSDILTHLQSIEPKPVEAGYSYADGGQVRKAA